MIVRDAGGVARMEKVITYRHNVIRINSPEAFLGIKGGYNKGCRDVYFARALGWGRDTAGMIADIDRKMGMETEQNRVFYTRVESLPLMPSREETAFYEEQFSALKSGKEVYVKSLKENAVFGNVLSFACLDALDKYRLLKRNMTESMEKNLAVKFLYWTDCVLGSALPVWNERKCCKVLADNVVKEQEYLFYYMLTLIGCDVLLFESREDIQTADAVKSLSLAFKLGEFCRFEFPEYKPYKEKENVKEEKKSETVAKSGAKPVMNAGVQVRISERKKRESIREDGREKSFEELALLASSIVMIEVHGRTGKPVGTGSGVMIGKDGFILTNHHVTRGGYSFSVRIEDDNNVYRTNEIIKYNSVFDLSVLRIGRPLAPLPVYKGGKKLARGQKVVAIGSPLGLFNSVSDGIISGFREIDSVDMIQFTAPISHGSSGGAVLNMQGEIIGISTAGFDGGQNINLAVGYETINLFIRGFTG